MNADPTQATPQHPSVLLPHHLNYTMIKARFFCRPSDTIVYTVLYWLFLLVSGTLSLSTAFRCAFYFLEERELSSSTQFNVSILQVVGLAVFAGDRIIIVRKKGCHPSNNHVLRHWQRVPYTRYHRVHQEFNVGEESPLLRDHTDPSRESFHAAVGATVQWKPRYDVCPDLRRWN